MIEGISIELLALSIYAVEKQTREKEERLVIVVQNPYALAVYDEEDIPEVFGEEPVEETIAQQVPSCLVVHIFPGRDEIVFSFGGTVFTVEVR